MAELMITTLSRARSGAARRLPAVALSVALAALSAYGWQSGGRAPGAAPAVTTERFSGLLLPSGEAIPNLSLVQQQIQAAYRSGQWSRAITYVSQEAIRAVDERAPGATKPAIVFDIDDTALSSYQVESRMNFGFVEAVWDKWAESEAAPANDGVLQLYRHALERGVAVFFVTGRHERLRAATEAQLRKGGYERWTGLQFKPDNYQEPSVVPYKSGARRRITEQGHRIIVNIGDQWSDLDGGYADATFKLPNPMYYIP